MNVYIQRQIPHPAHQVWDLVSDFYDMPWNAPYSQEIEVEGSGIGMIRRITLPSRDEPLVERLDILDKQGYRMAFTILSGIAAPVSDFVVDLTVKALSAETCRADVNVGFSLADGSTPEHMAYIIQYSYEEALQRLERYLDQLTKS